MTRKLILIGGMPGSGKTYIGKDLARHIGFFIDKDTVSRFFSEKILQLLGSSVDDRESPVYLDNVRDLEYDTMIKHALENLELGHSVICSAPFIREFSSQEWLDDIALEADLLDAQLIKIWIDVDLPTARERIIARGASRDSWKLANWDTYISTLPEKTPSGPDTLIIDNTRNPATPLFTQMEILLTQIAETRA